VRSYLDHNATSTLRPEAKAAMLRAMDCTGNASSVHGEGRAARKVLDDAREQVARAVGVIAPMVVFTSGGSEANNMALKGAPVERIIVSAVEHPSVLQAATASGKPVGIIPVDGNGVIDLGALEELLHGPKALVSVMAANNETGVVQPVGQDAVLVLGGWSPRCFSQADLMWIGGWAEKLIDAGVPAWAAEAKGATAAAAEVPETR
jgi:cysteine desulfurase